MPDHSQILEHPVTIFGVAFALIMQAVHVFDPIFAILGIAIDLVGATAGTWFPLLGVLSTLGRGLAFIPATTMSTLFMIGAAVYALYLARGLVVRVVDYLGKVRRERL